MSKVNFTSLASDDKSDLATLYVFKSDSLSVKLTHLSTVIESFFHVILSHGFFKHRSLTWTFSILNLVRHILLPL